MILRESSGLGVNPIHEMLFQGLRGIDASFHRLLYMVEKTDIDLLFTCAIITIAPDTCGE